MRLATRVSVATLLIGANVLCTPVGGKAGEQVDECFGKAPTIVGTSGDDEINGKRLRSDVILGLGGNDTIRGWTGDDLLCGGPGNDLLIGGGGYDKLAGFKGRDHLRGSGRPDDLYPGPGDDVVDGGTECPRGCGDDYREGVDAVYFSAALHPVEADLEEGYGRGQGRDTLSRLEGVSGSRFGDSLYGRMGAGDWIDASGGDDLLQGRGGDDLLSADLGNDRLFGGFGRDQLAGDRGRDFLKGGNGRDIAVFFDHSSDRDVHADLVTGEAKGNGSDDLRQIEGLSGGRGDDRLYGSDRRDLLEGDEGDDQLFGRGGNDRLVGGDSSYRLEDDRERDKLLGGPGNDWMNGVWGPDMLVGGEGSDHLIGDTGRDQLLSGRGADTVVPDHPDFNAAPRQHADCGSGRDMVVLGGKRSVTVDLERGFIASNHGRITLDACEGVQAADGDDVILGNGLPNRLLGGDGEDVIRGRAGRDRLFGGGVRWSWDGGDRVFGGSGNDVIRGGPEADRLEGGPGRDFLDGGRSKQDTCLQGERTVRCELPEE